MKRNNPDYYEIITTEAGGIDYAYYEARSRKIRSDSIFEMFASLFKDEKESAKESEVVKDNHPGQVAICH